MAVRRSARLRSKEEEKHEECQKRFRALNNKARVLCYSSSSDDQSATEEEVLAVTPSKRDTPKTNNYLKVYNSYNRDHGYDLYEREFIDDSEVYTPRRNRRRQRSERSAPDHSSESNFRGHRLKRRQRLKRSESDCSSDSNVGGQRSQCRAAAVNESSDEETSPSYHGNTAKGGVAKSDPNREVDVDQDDSVEVNRGTVHGELNVRTERESDSDCGLETIKRARNTRLDCYLSDSSDEEEEKVDKKSMKKRRVQLPESDDEIEGISPVAVRSSSRAERVKEEQRLKRDSLLQRMKNNDDVISTDKPSDSLDTYKEVFEVSKQKQLRDVQTLGERVLFPNESDSSSDEASDWIVSDVEEDYSDMEIMIGAHSSVLTHDPAPLYEVCDVGEVCGAGDGVDLESQLLQAVTGDDCVSVLTTLLPNVQSVINNVLHEGHTALMLAALRGDSQGLALLLDHGADIKCRDSSLTTPLHCAALYGCVECVRLLIARGHLVDCRDSKGWSPLLYAHFKDHQDCVLALMKARPQQLSVLSDLLKRAPEEGTEARRRTVKVVRSLLVSLAHHETYYSLFNRFIKDNLSVLDEDGFGFMSHCMALLSFDNKQAWLRGKLDRLKEYADMTLNGDTYSGWSGVSMCHVSRDRILETVRDRLHGLTDSPERCWIKSLYVTFRGEAGICTGPRKEFWSCLSRAVANDDKMFKQTDGGQLSLQPCSLLTRHAHTITAHTSQQHQQLLHLLGMMTAFAVFHGDTIDVSLSRPLLKKLVEDPLTHPDDLEGVDQTLYHTLTTYSDTIEDLELTFTATVRCPRTNQIADVPLKERGSYIPVTTDNKDEYIHELSVFNLDSSVREETQSFVNGFWKVIPKRCLQVFKANELSLVISGVPTINVKDWCRHTQYHGLSETDEIIVWFWRLVNSLKEEEKALLLKFSTGSPRVPAGGFSTLVGLSGPTLFTVILMPGLNKIPQASTCFNQLKLSRYSCEQELRNKVLIATRYGCEGFEFA